MHFFQLLSDQEQLSHPYCYSGHALQMRKLRWSAHLQSVPGFQQDGKTSAEKIVAQTEGTALMRNVEIISTCIFQPRKREGDRDAHLLFWFIIRQNGTEKLAAIRVFGVTAHEKDRARESAFERFKEEHPEFAMVPIVALDVSEPASR